MNDNTKWIKFDKNDKSTWPKESGYYFTLQFDVQEEKLNIIEYWSNPIRSWDNDLDLGGEWEFYYYTTPILFPDFLP